MMILMIRPVHFGYNAQTAVNNVFQANGPQDAVQQRALAEFDTFVSQLQQHNIDVLVINDTPEPHTPDSIFPNNWISFHEGGRVVLYPMFAANRRAERKESILDAIRSQFSIQEITDLTLHERDNHFLEGTGSMVLDRQQHLAYACISQRTNEKLFLNWCQLFGYTPCIFHATDQSGTDIYHTNVMMCVADRYVIICLDCIRHPEEKSRVIGILTRSGKTIIPISDEQMKQFAGNMLQIKNREGELFLVMSTQAYHSLTKQQQQLLASFNPIIHSPLDVIEANGGGSARCMMAEIYL